MAAYPHLASILYTWGLLSPGQLFDRVEVAAHLELVIFLFTLLGAGNLARRLVPGAAYAGTLMMLFPGVYLYDSALGLGADHVSALWAPMVGVGALRLRHDRSVAAWSIAALGACGAVLTKYTAVTLALGPGLALGALAALLVARVLTKREPASVLRGPLVALGLALLVTSPHWLKNALWYHNPVYPFMGKTFPSAPWSADAQARFEHMRFLAWAPTGTTGEKLRETLGAMFSFSFVPHDWPKFHGKVPVFGSLFTLGLVALPFLRRTARTWLLVGATYLGLFFWYWTQHEDRYLQTLVPWMAATVAATFTLAWRAHWAPRLGVLTLVGTQAVWGGDVPFIPARSMLGKPPIEAFSELLSQGYLRKHPQRLQVFEQYRALGALVPADAVLLVHDHNQRLGIGRRVVMDGPLFQGGLVYGREPSVAAAVQTLRRVGVTHVAWSPRTSRGQDSLASDLVFFDLAEHATVEPRRSGSFRVATLGDVAPEPRQPDKALFLGCPKSGYAQGLYPRVALSAPSGAKPETYVFPVPEKKVGKGISLEPLVAEARYVVRDPKCTKHVPGLDQFVLLAKREKTVELYGRPRGEAAERERGEEPPVAPEDTLD